MSDRREVRVPDVGGVEGIDVVEILVSPGDKVAKDDSLLVMATDKASMDLPSPAAGTVAEIKVKAGDQVNEGDLVLILEGAESGGQKEKQEGEPEGGAEESGGAPEESSGEGKKTSAEPPSPAPTADRKEPPPAVPRTASASGTGREPDLEAQLLVLGSGPGGYTAAFRAADLGMEVTLVERYPTLGGVCLNVGCIPSKALLHAAEVIDEAERFRGLGIHFGEPKIELDALRSWKESIVGKLTGGLKALAKRRKVRVVQGTGTLVGPHELSIAHSGAKDGDGEEKLLRFEQAILAAGSRVAHIPGLAPDDERVIDSTGALALDDVPERLLIVGGGIIGLEMACVYAALGSKVTIVELMKQLIPGADKDLVKPLARRLAETCEAIHLGTKVAKLEAKKKGLHATFEAVEGDSPEAGVFDRVLMAVGRRPNGDRLGAEAAGLTVDEKGFVPVDNRMRTNVPHIFAIGDLARPPMLAHKAVHEGKVAAEVAAGEKSAFDARVIPSVAYTHPEVAWVGLTETEAKEKDIPYEKGSFPWSASGRALALGADSGSTKILFDPETHRVLGGGIVGPGAGDLISELALAVEMGCEAGDIALTIHPHPTLSETVAFAAEAFEGTLTDLYVPKRKKKK